MTEEIKYQIKSRGRSRRIRIVVYPDGRVVITKPMRVAETEALKFFNRKRGWVTSKLIFYKTRKTLVLAENGFSPNQVLAYVNSRVEFYNQHYGFGIGKISIKNHKSLWGSCSRRRNLNFNSKIMQLPSHQADYIIVHELCHLQEFNHSPKFWALVAETIPNHKIIRRELRSYSFQ